MANLNMRQRMELSAANTSMSLLDQEQVNQILEDAYDAVLSDLPWSAFIEAGVAEELTDAGSGIAVTNRRVLDAWKDGIYARRWRSTTAKQLAVDNVTVPTATPIYYVDAGLAYVLPAGGTVLATKDLTIVDTTLTVAGVERMFLSLLAQKAAVLAIDTLMAEERLRIGDVIDVPAMPSVPAAPSISYSDAAATLITDVTIASPGTAPSYGAQSIALSGVTDPGDLDLTGLGAIPPLPTHLAAGGVQDLISYATALASDPGLEGLGLIPTGPQWDASGVQAPTVDAYPSKPSLPSLTVDDVPTFAPDAIGAQTVTLPAVPVYAIPVFPTGFDPTDPTLAVLNLLNELDDSTALDPPTAPSAPTLTYASALVSEPITIDVASLPDIPVFDGTQAVFANDWTAFDVAFGDDDESMSMLQVQKVKTNLEEEQSNLQEYMEAYRALVQEWQADVQAIVKNADSAVQVEMARAQLSSNTNLQNAMKAFENEVIQWKADVELYQTGANRYQLEVERQVQQIQINTQNALSVWTQQGQLYLRQYNEQVQNALGHFQGQMQAYNKEIDAAIMDARQAQEADSQDVANALADFQADVQAYSANVQADVSKHSADVQGTASFYGSEIQGYGAKTGGDINLYQIELSNVRGAFESNAAKFNADVQKVLQQAQINVQLANTRAQISNDVAQLNAAKELEENVLKVTNEIQAWQANVNTYVQEVQRELQLKQLNVQTSLQVDTLKRSGELEEFGALVQQANAKYQGDVGTYAQEIQKVIAQAQVTLQELSTEAQLATGVAQQNAIQTMQALVADYSATLQHTATKISLVQLEIQAEAEQFNETLNRFRSIVLALNADRDRAIQAWFRKKREFLIRFNNDFTIRPVYEKWVI